MRISPCLYNSNNPRTKRDITRADTDPRGIQSYSTNRLLIGLGPRSQRAARVAPRDKVEVPQHSESMSFHPEIRNSSIHIQFQIARDEIGDFPGHVAPPCVETPTQLGGC